MTSRGYTDKTLKLLWGLSAGRCAFPHCGIECVIQATPCDPVGLIGKIAHIVAHSDGGPRGDKTFPVYLRDEYENLILLCPNHHDQVDIQPNTYTTSDLRTWKIGLEGWVRSSLASEMPSVGFAELEITTKALVGSPDEPVANFLVTNPTEKLKRNSLTQRSSFLLTIGLSKAKEVEKFIAMMAAIDSTFPEQLKAGFIAQYEMLRRDGVSGDELFEGLSQFASANTRDFRRQAAGIAVLAYLFEKCEVFEA